MTGFGDLRALRKPRTATAILAILGLVFVLFAAAAEAAPKGDKGGGKGGGGGGGGGGSAPQPELHHQWRVRMDGYYSLVRPAVAQDGTIYAVDVARNLVAVEPGGNVLWTAANAGSKGVDVGPDGTIYTGTEDWIKAYRPNGSLKWTFTQTPRAFILADVAVGPDGNIYGLATSGMGVFSLADTPGGPVLRWTNTEVYSRPIVTYTEIEFGPTADGTDHQLYFYANGHTRAVRLSDGQSVFTVGGGNTPPRVSPLDGSWHRPATAYTPDGDLLWEFQFPLATGTSEPTLDNDGNHYVVNSARDIYGIAPNGTEILYAPLDENVGQPDVSPSEPILIVTAGGTQTNPVALKAVSTTSGGSLWRMEFPADPSGVDQFIGSGVAFSPDGLTGYVMTMVGPNNHTYLNAVDLDPSLPSASTVLRSGDVTLDVRSRRGSVNFSGTVSVIDENRGPISGATVSATWTLPDGSMLQQTATSGGTGEAKFNVSGAGGLYRIDVTGISLEGYAFDPAHSLLFAARAWF